MYFGERPVGLMALHLIVAIYYSGLPNLVMGVECIKVASYHEAFSFFPII